MANIGLTEQQTSAIKDWANRDQYVKAVRLFGSRAKGCAKPDSDVDLAVTANAGHYCALAAQWEATLTALLGLTVHIRDFARNKAIRDACDECSIQLAVEDHRIDVASITTHPAGVESGLHCGLGTRQNLEPRFWRMSSRM